MLTREPVSPLIEVTDAKPQTIWASWYLAWQERLADLRQSFGGALRKSLAVQLPHNDQGMAFALAMLLATLLYVSSLAMLAHFVLGHAADGMDAGIRSSLTVEVLNATAEQKDWKSAEERGKTIAEGLRKLPGVLRVETVPLARMRELLKPWLGEKVLDSITSGNAKITERTSEKTNDKTADDTLTLPLLLDVQLDAHAKLDRSALKQIVDGVPGAALDDHGQFLSQLTRFGQALRDVSLYILTLGFIALLLCAFFAAQAGFYMNREMIGILHLIGAEDNAIAQHAGLGLLRLMLLASAIALGITFVTLILVVRSGTGMDVSLFPNFDIGILDWVMLIFGWLLLYAFAIGACLLAARFTVLQALRKLL